ncbi:iron complex outermembrane receptor protein [Caulobacter ginsengisoli]|uniref:Iron complex outermembrane receptor protein n=1 Tax=Caulobacter ginsengisoli TaxID=400775 RepID=A0ABU0IS72_9CAUL|nr:TonB-dependent receptor [Caulobacter ginsengisoli]MDQ0464859.1 iron complex outermembrane receptor protein [Caulobacter ginsengisoli]
MRRIAYLASGSALAIALSISGVAAAQGTEPVDVEAVIVTGSLIAGTPEDAALPVDVIGQEELAKQGSPSTVELLKGLSVSNGVLGDTNQFDARAQGSEGSGSVNLRGLGPTRTLVLLNGRRMPINPFGLAGAGAVDTNIIPSAALARVEVLKDGAAATYGSDAIGGVVNFITRKSFDGAEVSGSYKVIDGSDGDYTGSIVWGWGDDRQSILLTAGYQHRSELSMTERDWSQLDYTQNPEGGWSAAGNPSTFVPLGTLAPFRDDQCSPLGGFAGFSGTTPVCYWRYNSYDNLVEKEDRYQLFASWDVDLTATTKFHLEGLYASTDVPNWKTSPSYALLATPNSVTAPAPSASGRYYVPVTNPGFAAYIAAHPGGVPGSTQAQLATGTSVFFPGVAPGAFVVANRPYALGGNPMFNYGASEGSRGFHAWRFVADLNGEWENGIGWDVSATWGQERGTRTGYDTVVSRFQLALRGLGGPGCDYLTGTPGVGPCQWFNPFSNAIPSNAITGQTNATYNPALANSPALTRWFFQKLETEQTTSVFVLEAVLNGKAWTMGGGDAAWALGAQYRRQTFDASYNDLSNRALNPCVDTPINGNKVCANGQGPFAFLGVGNEVSLDQGVYSVFGELSLPFSDNFNASLAARYEDYGGAVGSTFNPKLSVRWQVVEPFALRASVGTTFRAPPPVSLNNDFITSLQSINGTFRAVDIYGNPNLQPEKATTYSVGAIFELGGLKATLDYWNFDFQDPITTDPVSGIVAALFPNGAALPNNCGNPTYASIQALFTFNGACSSANITRLRTNTVNGAGVKTSGLDFLADWKFDDIMGGTFTVGGGATYVLEYKTEATQVAGITVAPAFDAVGHLNYQTTAYPLPQWKGNVYFEYNNGPHNLRWTVRYIGEYTDLRGGPAGNKGIFCTVVSASTCAALPYKLENGTPFGLDKGYTIDAFVTSDLTYRVFLPWDTTAVVSVDNLFDEDPPFARLDLNYDPFTASGLGRTYKFSLTKRF